MPTVDIPIRDEFDDDQGRLYNYDCYDEAQRKQLAKQKHVDIRSFVQTDTFVPSNLGRLDQLSMGVLDTMTMSSVGSPVLYQKGEAWTVGTVTPQADRNSWNGISMNCSVGTNITTSVLR